MTTTIDEMLARARSNLTRIAPEELESELEAGAIVVDVRDSSQRETHGELPGAKWIDLTVLEWRLAPSSEHRSVEVADAQKVILVCSDGYSSSLAAARLQELGLSGATDVIGGFHAWQQMNHP